MAERLEGSPHAFAQLAATVLEGKPAWAELLVFVDQFEELFSVVAERCREPFVAMLAAATPFSIAKYPVTYRQYKAFVEDAGGYRSERWWEGVLCAPHPLKRCSLNL